MLITLRNIFFITLCLSLFSNCSQSKLQIDEVTVDYMENPLNVSSTRPRFRWQLSSEENGVIQSAYQLSVSQKGKELWNSGKVNFSQSQRVIYSGKALEASKKYDVAVTVWDQSGNSTSSKTTFRTVPESLNAQWIGAIRRENAHLPKGRGWHAPSLRKNREMYDSIPALAKRSIMLRKELNVTNEVKSAILHISGLGHYELSLNGEKVGKSQFAPLWTDYDRTVLYNTYELTEEIQQGANAFGVHLGNGMYNAVGDRYRKFWVSFGPPTLLFQLEVTYEDGTQQQWSSDMSWKYVESPIMFNDIFGGEDYDARLEPEGWNMPGFDDEFWKPVIIQDAPKGSLKPQHAPAVEIQQQFKIKQSYHIDSATYVFDMGQNLSGFPTLTVKGKAGQTVKLIVGERLKDDHTVTQKNTGGPHFYQYTLKGNGKETWQPRFSYYGYQYIQVEGVHYGEEINESGLPELLDLKSNFIYSNAEEIGSFECSNEIFTKTHTLINNAMKSNMQAVFTDCPHREKLGWLEEIYLNGPGLLYNYDLTQLLRKEMQDMADAQRPNGLVPNIAPEYVNFSRESWGADFTDSPEWGTAAVMVPWLYYQYYGDASLVENYYDVIRRYVDYLTSRAENGIVSHGLGDWYDYGEHAAGYSKNSPIALSATSHYYVCIQKLAEVAKLTGKRNDFSKYASLADSVETAFNQEFFNPETNQYGTGSQFCNAVAIYLGLVSPENKQAVLDNLVADIKAHGNRLTTGDVGNRYLFQTLAENGLNELLYDMVNHYDVPGYGYQLQYGLTTLTEQWDPERGNSWNHFMLGQIEEWFFKSLAGIKPDPERPGFKHFIIQPEIVGDLTFVKASTQSLYGKIAVDWKVENDQFNISLEIPVNSSATFIVPKGLIMGDPQVDLPSGTHAFSFPMQSTSK